MQGRPCWPRVSPVPAGPGCADRSRLTADPIRPLLLRPERVHAGSTSMPAPQGGSSWEGSWTCLSPQAGAERGAGALGWPVHTPALNRVDGHAGPEGPSSMAGQGPGRRVSRCELHGRWRAAPYMVPPHKRVAVCCEPGPAVLLATAQTQGPQTTNGPTYTHTSSEEATHEEKGHRAPNTPAAYKPGFTGPSCLVGLTTAH